MSVIYITYDLIKRLLNSSASDAHKQLRDEIRDLLELGAASWLPDELTIGADAVAYLIENASASERQKLTSILEEIVNCWNANATWSDKASRGALGIVGCISQLSSDFPKHHQNLTHDLLGLLDRFELSGRALEISGCPLPVLSKGFVRLLTACDSTSSELYLENLVRAAGQFNTKLSIDCGLHILYALCAHDIAFSMPQAILARILKPWISTIAHAGYQSGSLSDKSIRQIQRYHDVAGKRLHHLLYRTWIMHIPRLVADRISSSALSWVADRADIICGVEPTLGAFNSANSMMDLLLRKLPRSSVKLVVQAQDRELTSSKAITGDAKTSESYQATKIICLDMFSEWPNGDLFALNANAERAARIAPDISEKQFRQYA